MGKSPLLAGFCLLEALGDVILDGWDADGEPVARSWNSLGFKPNVHLLAVSADQTANTWTPLLEMARYGPVQNAYEIEALDTFINVPNGKIEFMTSAAISREGGRPVFSVFDQALALDTPIPTPSGWATMGGLVTGDFVFGSDGKPTRVSEAKPVSVEHDCYRVQFSDGTSIVASAGHLWKTKLMSAAAPQIRTTRQMVLDGRTFRVPVSQPFVTPSVELPVPPYLLGLWLGDGTRAKCELSVSVDDLADVQDALRNVGVESWPRIYETVGNGYGSADAGQVNLTFSRGHGYQNSNRPVVAKRFGELACYRDKHVPDVFMRASVVQRTELLRGLMDSDGCCTKNGHCTFVNTNRRIVDSVVELLRSLGQVTSGAVWVVSDRYTNGGRYRVDFTARGGFQPFRLPRKAALVRQHAKGPKWVTVSQIEAVPRVPVRCIAVESADHLFAAGVSGHLTHNTESWNRTNGGLRLAGTERRNLTKVQGASIETPNAFIPGEESVAEKSFEAYSLQERKQLKGDEGGILLDHREAPIETDIDDRDSLLAGFADAYGDSADVKGGWVNLKRVLNDFWDPDTEPSDARRFFLNQVTAASDAWLSRPEWAVLYNADRIVPDGEHITMGFDGSRKRNRGVTDSTALIGCTVDDGHLFEIAVWEQPTGPAGKDWEVPREEVNAAVRSANEKYKVVGFYADPAKWENDVAAWEAKYGRRMLVKSTAQHPIEWWMTGGRIGQIAKATEALEAAVRNSQVTHDGSYVLTRHMLNARRNQTPSGVTIRKEHPDSARKIDAAVAAVLAFAARRAAISAGLANRRKKRSGAKGF